MTGIKLMAKFFPKLFLAASMILQKTIKFIDAIEEFASVKARKVTL
jgi:hypothetical protein